MNINTIIEEEIERLRDLYLSESPDENGAVTTSTTFSWATFDITQKQEKIAYYLMTQEGIEESFTTAMQRAYEAGEREADAKWEKGWLIWSNEHDAWWAINRIGYTRSRKMAGRYTFGQALEIVRHANCRNGDRPFEAMVEDVDDDEVAKEMGRA